MIPIKNPKNVKLGGSSYFGKKIGSSVRSAGRTKSLSGSCRRIPDDLPYTVFYSVDRLTSVRGHRDMFCTA